MDAAVDPLEDLQRLGQKRHVQRSTLEEVQERMAFLREQTRAKAEARDLDFSQRVKELKDARRQKNESATAEIKSIKEEARRKLELSKQPDLNDEESVRLAATMGFSSFGKAGK